jgi:hypothetical protein
MKRVREYKRIDLEGLNLPFKHVDCLHSLRPQHSASSLIG